MKRGQAGGIAVVAKHGEGHMRKIGREGGYATLNKYGDLYYRCIGSAGGIRAAAKRKARLYRDGVSMEVTL